MTLRFGWEWERALEVKTPELAATWSRLTIEVVGVTATLVEERFSAHGIRKSIDVPTYPLAEWIAFNWWAIWAPRARNASTGFHLPGAGDGFPWPDLTFLSGAGSVSASLRRRDREPDFVRFLSSVEAVLEPEAAAAEMARFVDATVRQLEDTGIAGTPLQLEWAEIVATTGPEREFCLVAAAMGLDPYDLGDDETEQILLLEPLSGSSVAADLAGAVDPGSLTAAQEWAEAAVAQVRAFTGPQFDVETQPLPFGERVPPWSVGYGRARRVRKQLSVGPIEQLGLEDLIGIITVDQEAPVTVSGLVGAREHVTTVAVGAATQTARRFTGARALGRRTFDPHLGELLLTATYRPYAEKVERAFAAEFLAPADGVAELLDGDYSEAALGRVARRFDVDRRVIEHQVETQLIA